MKSMLRAKGAGRLGRGHRVHSGACARPSPLAGLPQAKQMRNGLCFLLTYLIRKQTEGGV